MAKAHSPDELSWRVFRWTLLGILAWIATSFAFVILAE